jgi:hypothetical protein
MDMTHELLDKRCLSVSVWVFPDCLPPKATNELHKHEYNDVCYAPKYLHTIKLGCLETLCISTVHEKFSAIGLLKT